MSTETSACGIRTVVFLTATSDESIPHDASQLACLQPAGWYAFAERVMESCAQAGLTHVDVVACDQPEQLRQVIGHGERWGLKLTWHLVKDGNAPYVVLRQLSTDMARVIIGHAQCWIDAPALTELCREDGAAVLLDANISWTGWASFPSTFVRTISPHSDAQTLVERVMAVDAGHFTVLDTAQYACAGTAQHLLKVQRQFLRPESISQAPASWIHTAWGLLSPDAWVHTSAVIHGPAVIGPGCIVEKGSVIGPNTVLFRDVFVASGASVEESLVMSSTHLDNDAALSNVLAQGSFINHVGGGFSPTPLLNDAVVTPLHRSISDSIRLCAWTGRLIAGLLFIAGLPVLAALCLVNALTGNVSTWVVCSAVQGWQPDGSLRLTPVRQSRAHANMRGALIGAFGAVLDVLQGRRAWFGMRARTAGEWYALNRDWQRMFAKHPIGLFNARAWPEGEHAGNVEALAVADAYFFSTSSWREKITSIVGAVTSWRHQR